MFEPLSLVFNLYVSIIDCKNYKHSPVLMGGINNKHPAILIGETSGPWYSARISPVKLAEPTMDGAWMDGLDGMGISLVQVVKTMHACSASPSGGTLTKTDPLQKIVFKRTPLTSFCRASSWLHLQHSSATCTFHFWFSAWNAYTTCRWWCTWGWFSAPRSYFWCLWRRGHEAGYFQGLEPYSDVHCIFKLHGIFALDERSRKLMLNEIYFGVMWYIYIYICMYIQGKSY